MPCICLADDSQDVQMACCSSPPTHGYHSGLHAAYMLQDCSHHALLRGNPAVHLQVSSARSCSCLCKAHCSCSWTSIMSAWPGGKSCSRIKYGIRSGHAHSASLLREWKLAVRWHDMIDIELAVLRHVHAQFYLLQFLGKRPPQEITAFPFALSVCHPNRGMLP